jgi:beta-galactosidase
VEAVASEIAELPDAGTAKAEVALIFDYPSEWAWTVLPQGADFNYFRLMLEAYRALRRRGLSIDILPSATTDLSRYKLVLAPGIAALPESLKTALTKTQAIVGPRSNAVTPDLTIPSPMGPDLPGLSCIVTRVESLPPGTMREVAGGGTVRHWCETLEGDAAVALHLEDGSPLLMRSGRTAYLGGWPDSSLWDRIISEAAARSGLELLELPEGLRVRDTDTHRFYFNYSLDAIDFVGLSIPAAGVYWEPR